MEKLQKSVLSPINHLNLPHSTRLKLYKEIDSKDYYLIGVDTASSIDNCYSAIEVYSFKDFEQVGELAIRLGSLSQYSDIVQATAKYFADKTGGRIILCIENNSIGKAIVEAVAESNLVYYMFHEKDKVDQHGIVTEWGINTNGRTKPLMVAECYSHINEHPSTFHSQELVDQLNSLERNNAGQVSSKAYTEKNLYKKEKQTEVQFIIKNKHFRQKEKLGFTRAAVATWYFSYIKLIRLIIY